MIGAPAGPPFAVESTLDELADLYGLDPAEFRRRNLPHGGAASAALDAVLREARWERRATLGPWRGLGLAAGEDWAHVVEVDGAAGAFTLVIAWNAGVVPADPAAFAPVAEAALANALAHATGRRLRELPLTAEQLRARLAEPAVVEPFT